MEWPKPQYSREKINLAGNYLLGKPAPNLSDEDVFEIINNWRVSHNFPLNTFQTRMRRLAKSVDSNCIVAQRIKRLSSIKHKLERFPKMKLSQIQDIGGCRAIVSSVEDVDELVKLYIPGRGVKHSLEKETNYILNPPVSGYRGVHLIYKYRSDKNEDYEDLKIEIQIRTYLQHAWATAVETVSTFFKQALKSSQGDAEWLRFFQLMGSVMAIQENRPLIPNTPIKYPHLRREIISLERKLKVTAHLKTFRDSLSIFDEERDFKNEAHYYLLELDVNFRRILIKSYQQNELEKASSDYLISEKRNSTIGTFDTVLVSADSLEKLKIAYPNYYLDTALFLQCVTDIIKRPSKVFAEAKFTQGEFHFK